MEQTPERTNLWIGRALLLFAVFALCWQARSLYTFPIPDSVNYWYGDESWLMFEARAQASDGVLRHPYAYGATLNDQAGVLIGNSWGASLLYGLPAFVFSHSFPAIAIGRTVTFGLALLAVFAMFFIALRLGVSPLVAGFASILLATSPAFTIASHSARSDLLVGLVVMLVVAFFTRELAKNQRERSAKWWFGFGAIITLLALIFAIHLVTLLLPLALFLLIRLGAFRNFKLLLAALAGVVAATIVLVGSYALLTHDLSLFGTSGQHVQFVDVAAQKPFVRLFSRSVQLNNMAQRFALLWSGAPALMILIVLSLIEVVVIMLRKRTDTLKEPRLRALLTLTLIVGASWLLLQGSISYYMPHFLLLAVLAAAVLADRSLFASLRPLNARAIIASAALVLLVMHVREVDKTIAASRFFSNENQRAVSKLQNRIHSEIDSTKEHLPVVLAESPAAYRLELDSSITLMSPLFPAFPKYDDSIAATLARYHVRYALLYDGKELHDNIAGVPKLTAYIESRGTLVDTAMGIMFDMKRSYIHPDVSSQDTMKLYRLNAY